MSGAGGRLRLLQVDADVSHDKKNSSCHLVDSTGIFGFGVADGARTHDNRNHNPGLYQLSYSHRSLQL
jgi:hypothetical protein